MPDLLWLLAASLSATTGMGWLALAQEAHWQRVHTLAQGLRQPLPTPAPSHSSRRFGVRGAVALFMSLVCCLASDPAAIAVLVWIMLTMLAALIIALTLTWRPHYLRLLT